MGAPLQMLEQWRDLNIDMQHVPWADRLARVMLELNVERSPRYAPTDTLTWCNIYVTDVIAAMGVRAPRHWVTSTGEPATIGKGIELSANKLLGWFETHGPRYGWMQADSRTAQDAAARGHLVVVGWRNPKPSKPGHVSIVIGRDRVSTAGRTNRFISTVKESFGRSMDDKALEWYIQMDRPGGHNDV